MPKINFSRTNSIRLDPRSDNELEPIAAFERKKKGELLRDMITEKIKAYERNPQYQRWKRDHWDTKAKEVKESSP